MPTFESIPTSDRDALLEIGNIVGAPTMDYAPDTERAELLDRINRISAIVQKRVRS